jgi:hypothetical protein
MFHSSMPFTLSFDMFTVMKILNCKAKAKAKSKYLQIEFSPALFNVKFPQDSILTQMYICV